MRIRFFISTLGGGGAEKVLVDLVNRLCGQGVQCYLTTVIGGINRGKLSNQVQYKQIIPEHPKWLSYLLSAILFRMPRKLVRWFFLAGIYDMEIAYLEGFPTQVVGQFPKSVKKIAFVHCDVSVDNPIAAAYANADTCLREYVKFDRVAFVSKQARNGFLCEIGDPGNTCVVHNVLEMDDIFSKSKQKPVYRFQTGGCKLVTVGRLTEPKKFDRLLRIAERLEKAFDFELLIVGDGDLRAALESYIVKHRIKSVRMLGYQTNPYAVVRQADLFVCSSLYEGYSTAVTEALLLDVPVLTTDCAGMDEMVLEGCHGWIVQNSEEALEEKMEWLLKHPVEIERMKNRLQRSTKKYNANKALEEYLELFGSVIK